MVITIIQSVLSIIASLLHIFPHFRGKAFVVIPEKEVDDAREKEVLRNQPSKRWNGLAFFKKYRYSAAEKAAKKIAVEIKNSAKTTPDLIIGIGRGGAIFGSMLSYRLENTPILIVDRTYLWDSSTNIREDGMIFDFDFPQKFKGDVLVVAGEYHSGMTMANYCTYLRGIGVDNIKTCVFYVERGLPQDPKEVDYHGEEGIGCPLMPWQDRDTIRDSISAADAEKLKKRISSRHKRIFIVRHGETAQNKDGIFIGVTDASLNSTGKRQAEEAGEFIKQYMIQKASTLILYSPLERCFETAYQILGRLPRGSAQIKQWPPLKERNYGVWEGMSRTDISFNYRELYEQYEKDTMNCVPPGADPMEEIVNRANIISIDLAGMCDQNIVLVTHKTTGRVLLSILLNKPIEKFRDIPFKNGQVVIIDSRDGELKEIIP